MTDQAPTCPSCTRRHSPELRCWAGRYVYACLQLVLDVYGDTCCHCGQGGADTVEHVRPRSRWGTDDLTNMRPAHRRCNSRRGTRAMPGYGARTIVVTGPPASGKSTYVAEHAVRGDVVIDLDLLARALGVGVDDHDYPAHVRHVAIGARTEAIHRATALREAVTVWLIHATPTDDQIREYDTAGYQIVEIDPGPDIVLDRCARLRPRAAYDHAAAYYATRTPTPTTSRSW